MVLTKETALNKTVLPGSQETTITTRTTEVPLVQQAHLTTGNTIHKDAIVTNVMEKPILENVIEKKNVEVHHKNVVQEIHEQKIIEIEKQNLVQNVHQPTLVQQERAATKYEEIGNAGISEQERLRLAQLQAVHAPKITQTGGVTQVQEGEQVAQVVRQEFIEHHVQPVITEVREQNIVQEVVHPVVRKVHEAPIIREVQSTGVVHQTGLVGVQQGALLHNEQHHQHGGLLHHEHQTGLQQTGVVHQTGVQQGGLVGGLLHHDHHQTGLQQTGVVHQTGVQQGGLVGGLLHHDHHQTGLQQGGLVSGVQQGGLHQTGVNQTGLLQQTNMTTNTAGTGLHGTTTTTSGNNPIMTEQRNMNLHEQKVVNTNAPLNNAERQNLAVHEQVVDKVVTHNTTGVPHTTTGVPHTTTGVPHNTTTTTTGTHLGNEEKPGFMDRVKEKLHIGHHNTTNTTHTTK